MPRFRSLPLGEPVRNRHILGHAPCVDPDEALDAEFPIAGGGVGPHTGWSFHEARFVSPEDGYFDLMSYCHPEYISEYHYEKAMGWGDRIRTVLARNETTIAVSPDSDGVPGKPRTPLDMAPLSPISLALSGSVDGHGTWRLFAWSTSTKPARVDARGDYSISLFDDAGVELYSQSLATSAISRSDKRLWAVRVPIQSRPIDAVRVRGKGGNLLLDAFVALPGREPEDQAESDR